MAKKQRTSRKKAPRRVSTKKVLPTTTGGRLPFLLFVTLLLGIAAALVIEVRNYIDYPSIDQFESPSGDHLLTIYHRGSGERHGQVLIETGTSGPHQICQIRYADADRAADPPSAFEELRWSGDSSCVIATRVAMRSKIMPHEVLWIYDSTNRRLFLDEDAQPQLDATSGSQADLVEFLFSRGGRGEPITNWYQLGKKERYLFSWQTTKWERALE